MILMNILVFITQSNMRSVNMSAPHPTPLTQKPREGKNLTSHHLEPTDKNKKQRQMSPLNKVNKSETVSTNKS